MLKKIIVLVGIFFLSSLTAYAENNLNSLWKTVQAEQTQDLPEGLSGAWLENITLKGKSKILFSDLSPFSALQIMLRLDAMQSSVALPGYLEVKKKFKPFINYYLNHRLKDEPYGAIGFWPVWQLEDGTVIRAPSTDPAIREVTGDTLSADSDDSSQMAIWLQKTEPGHPFINAYLKMLENILDENRTTQSKKEASWKDINSGAFLTWVREPGSENNVDCVVNINVLTSLSLIKKSVTLSNKLQQAEMNSSDLIYKALTQSQFPTCSYYYSRWSQFYLALGKLYETGGGVFNADQWKTIRSAFKSTLLTSWRTKNIQSTNEWAEFLIASQMFGLTKDAELSRTLADIKQYLLEEVNNENYYSLIEGNDVFRGDVAPGMTLLWYVKAQTATLLLEALIEEKKAGDLV
ncbi:MAG: hypothetical protein ACD_46C00278G0010 [uncultured bacterium]|nr:MAG: hypothetical protein ACD_46C00278G0010 [uncultured bacterium]